MDKLNMNQMEAVNGGGTPSLSFDDSDEIRGIVRILKNSGYDKEEALSYLTRKYYANPIEQLRKIVNEVYGK